MLYVCRLSFWSVLFFHITLSHQRATPESRNTHSCMTKATRKWHKWYRCVIKATNCLLALFSEPYFQGKELLQKQKIDPSTDKYQWVILIYGKVKKNREAGNGREISWKRISCFPTFREGKVWKKNAVKVMLDVLIYINSSIMKPAVSDRRMRPDSSFTPAVPEQSCSL